MSRYTEDGGVIPNSVPFSSRDSQQHNKLFGLYRGMVVRTVYPDDPQNSNGERVEYVVRVGRQEYPNAINMRVGAGVFNFNERIRKEAEKSFSGKFDRATYDENLDGENVFVLFLEGSGNVPVIVGADHHPKQGAYKKFKKEDGRFDYEEFNGLEFLIDKDSNYTIKHVGRKDPEGAIKNQEAVGSQIKMYGNGDIEFDTHGDGGTADLRMKFTKEDKKVELYAQNNKAIMDSTGILVKDKFDNSMQLESGRVTFTAVGDAKLDASGKAEVIAGGDLETTSGGNTKVTANGNLEAVGAGNAKFEGTGGTSLGSSGSVTDVKGSVVKLAGGGVPVARLGDMAIGMGNLGAPVISNIAQGSPKVTSG